MTTTQTFPVPPGGPLQLCPDCARQPTIYERPTICAYYCGHDHVSAIQFRQGPWSIEPCSSSTEFLSRLRRLDLPQSLLERASAAVAA